MYPAKKAYLDRARPARNLNLDIRDIKGTYPLQPAERLDQRLLRAKNTDASPSKPYQPTTHYLPDEFPKQGNSLLVSQNYNPRTNNSRRELGRVDNPSPTRQPNTPNREPSANGRSPQPQARDGSNSRSITPEYKYVGKKETRPFTNKADLRFDIKDINQRKSRWANLVQPDKAQNQQAEDYHKLQQLDRYERGLTRKPITSEVVFQNGHRPDAPRLDRPKSQDNGPAIFRPTVYDYANSALRNLDQNHYLKRNEAEFFMRNNALVLREFGDAGFRPNAPQRTDDGRRVR